MWISASFQVMPNQVKGITNDTKGPPQSGLPVTSLSSSPALSLPCTLLPPSWPPHCSSRMKGLLLLCLCQEHSEGRQAHSLFSLRKLIPFRKPFSASLSCLSVVPTPRTLVLSSLLDFSLQPLSPSKTPVSFILFSLPFFLSFPFSPPPQPLQLSFFLLFPSLDYKCYEVLDVLLHGSIPSTRITSSTNGCSINIYWVNGWCFTAFIRLPGLSVSNASWCSCAGTVRRSYSVFW